HLVDLLVHDRVEDAGDRRHEASIAPARASRTGVRTLNGWLRFDPQDLGEGGATDLELALVGLARADQALQLETRPAQGLRDRRGGVALAPGEHLDRDGSRRDRDARTGHRAGLFDHA